MQQRSPSDRSRAPATPFNCAAANAIERHSLDAEIEQVRHFIGVSAALDQLASNLGKLAGTNRIGREYDGCVVHERYVAGSGYRGESRNVYNASRGVWHQTWVDNAGTLLVLEGGLRDGSMVLEGETRGADARMSKHRITWTPTSDGGLRQHWETDKGDGTWVDTFDGRYARK